MLAIIFVATSVTARQTAGGDPNAAKIKNPVASTPESLAAGKQTFTAYCAACHGAKGEGAEKAGIVISVIEDQGGKQPPDLTDDKWDHGSSDGEIFTVIKKGVGPQFFMAPWDGRISDTEIWNTINYVRSLAPKKQ
jgi:mono/diheme cytochrome c family protein